MEAIKVPYVKLQKGTWLRQDFQKTFLDNVAKDLQLQRPQDWGKVPTRIFVEKGGATLLRRNRGSIFKTLQTVYKGTI